MLVSELLEIIKNGESSGVEFKLDTIENFRLAAEIAGLANFRGGVVLLGVDDAGKIVGTSRQNLEEWVMELCRVKISPPLIPYFEVIKDVEPGKDVAVINILPGPDKPYARLHDNKRAYYIRVGSTTREADQNELARMFQESGYLRYGQKPVPGTAMEDLDFRRVENYFLYVLGQTAPDQNDKVAWGQLLKNLEFAIEVEQRLVLTIDGLLLFGRNPKRFLPQSGIRTIAYRTNEPSYETITDKQLTGPIVPLLGPDKSVIESGLIENVFDFIYEYSPFYACLERGRMIKVPAYPDAALREALVNAIAHRDYAVAGADIQLSLFPDKLEINSPGRLPNSATIEAIKTGFRFARNQVLVNVLRDYGYVDARGMGIKYKMIPEMLQHNGTEPEFEATEHSLTVRLLRKRATS